MESYNDHKRYLQIFFGVLLLVLGVAMLLDNMEVMEFRFLWGFWPFVISAFGVNKILQANGSRGTRKGAWLVFLGVWLYVSMHHVIGYGFRDTWPMLIIIWECSWCGNHSNI